MPPIQLLPDGQTNTPAADPAAVLAGSGAASPGVAGSAVAPVNPAAAVAPGSVSPAQPSAANTVPDPVRHDIVQNLSDPQEAQARENIGAVGRRRYRAVSADDTLTASDEVVLIEVDTSMGPVDITVPQQSAVAFVDGASIAVRRLGANAVNFVTGGALTIESPGGANSINVDEGVAVLTRRAADDWLLTGEIS